MDRISTNHLRGYLMLLASLTLFAGVAVHAQVPADNNAYPVESLADNQLTAGDLATLVGPIALYPDDLLAIVLPASTYPLQIVQAARFLQAYENDSSLKPDESWDDSVVALINYPDVIRLLNDDIDWTWRLGEAVIDQQVDVISAVESFRDRAYAAGNLKSDEYQTVSKDNDIIEIVPIEDDVIYVPYYEPERVVVRQPRPVYNYYPQPYPVYDYPYPAGYSFSSGYFWGVTTAFRIGWASDRLSVYHPSYWGHPYYGRQYYSGYYRRPSIDVYNTVYVNNSHRYSQYRNRDGDYWRPNRHSGARQADYYTHSRQYRTDVRSVRNSVGHGTTNRSRNDRGNTGRRNAGHSNRSRAVDTRQSASRRHTATNRRSEQVRAPREDTRRANRATRQQRQQPQQVARRQPTRAQRQQPVRATRQQTARAQRQQPVRATRQQTARAQRQQPVRATRQQTARAQRQQPARAPRQQTARAQRQQPARATRQQTTRATRSSGHGQSQRQSSRGRSERRQRHTK